MKEIKIALSGEKEEQIAQHIMKSVYEAINEHGYYLPTELLPESFEDLTFEEFFELYGQADCAREMRIEDIETGVAKGIADNFSNDE